MPNEQTTASDDKALADQYDLGDTSFDPELDGDPSEGFGAKPPRVDAPAAANPPPKDPKTGRFVAPSKHSKLLVKLATEAGLHPDEIEEASPEDLRAVIAVADRQRLLSDRQRDYDKPSQQSQPPAAAEAKHEPVDDLDPGEEYDDKIRGTFKTLADRLAKLEAKAGQLEQFQVGQQQASLADQVDGLFAKHERVFGKGRGYELDKSGGEFARRKAVLALADSDKDAKPYAAKVAKAIKLLYGAADPVADEPDEPAPAKRPAAAAWQDGGLARPSHRNGRELPKGERRATIAVAAKMREMPGAMDVNGYDGNEESGLPD